MTYYPLTPVATEATPDDFFALGLHPDALTSALAMVSRVAHVGGGSGRVATTEDSSPLGVYDVRIQVVTPGAPGAATVRSSRAASRGRSAA